MCVGGEGLLLLNSPQSHMLDRRRLMEGEGGFASVPEEQTCVLQKTITRQVACARNCAGFRGDAGMSAGARSAINSIATAEVGGQERRTSTAGVSQSTGQRSSL